MRPRRQQLTPPYGKVSIDRRRWRCIDATTFVFQEFLDEEKSRNKGGNDGNRQRGRRARSAWRRGGRRHRGRSGVTVVAVAQHQVGRVQGSVRSDGHALQPRGALRTAREVGVGVHNHGARGVHLDPPRLSQAAEELRQDGRARGRQAVANTRTAETGRAEIVLDRRGARPHGNRQTAALGDHAVVAAGRRRGPPREPKGGRARHG